MCADLGRIGHYHLEALLGRGGMGQVYLAWDERLRRHVAIKRILKRSAETTPQERALLRREARAVASLSHPAIVQVYDVIEDNEGAGESIVMEHVAGETLSALLRHGALELPLALRLAREVAEGLVAAHARGLVHRDLKAANVMLTAAGHAKILDFGLALALPGGVAHRPRGRAGTLEVMAPEQLSGGEVDQRTDLFALGVLLWEMATGSRPFPRRADRRPRRPATDLRSSPTLLEAALPPRLVDLLVRLLANDPGRRPANAEEVAAALREMETAPGTPAARAPRPDSAPDAADLSRLPTLSTLASGGPARPLRRPGRALAAAAALLILLLVAAGPHSEPAAPRRILVLRPTVAPGGDRAALRLVGSSVLTAALDALAHLPGAVPLDPSEAPGGEASPTALGRATASDEVLRGRVEPGMAAACQISLERLDARSGAVLAAMRFEAPLGESRQLRLVGDAVTVHLDRLYRDLEGASHLPTLAVRDEDYATFLEVWQGFRKDGLATPERQQRIAAALSGSPRFLPALLLATDLATTRFSAERDPASLERARHLLDRAAALAPDDPRPLYRRFHLHIFAGEPERAEAVIERLERLAPGDPEIAFDRARLAEARKQPDRARELLLAAVGRAPSWGALYRLATVEIAGGHIGEARGHLQALLALSPDNVRGLAKLAELELLYGDLGRAEELYRRQIELAPRLTLYTNLGLAQFLDHRYSEAVASYETALTFDPDHPVAQLDLADAEDALGERESARRRYRRVLERMEALRAAAPWSAGDQLLVAQCRAHLGQERRAVETAKRILSEEPRDGDLAFQAAVVFALAGEPARAIAAGRQAIDLGITRRWLTLPAFAALRSDPGFAALLAGG